jgi:hypothetical protein
VSGRIFASSYERYYGGVSEKRKYGGQGTVTRFLVGYEGSEASTWRKVEGHGKYPSTRKADAIRRFLEIEAGATPAPLPIGVIGD